MRITDKLSLFWAIMVNEFKIVSREPGGLIILIIMPYLVAGGMAAMASFFTRVNGVDFIRQFIGFEVIMVSVIMVQTGARFLNEERSGGRLEALMATPVSMYMVLFATSMVMVLVNVGAYVVASLPIIYGAFGLSGLIRLIPSMIIIIIGLMPLYGIGLALAGVVIRIRDVDALMNVVTSLITVLSGATYPLYVLPKWINAIVVAMPMYQLYQTTISIIMGNGASALLYGLIASTVAYLMLGVFTYGRIERSVLKSGIR
ncbi:ABC transporter permease [Caldivirga sp. UBA161]|uniref:ABC transporter permease n=1 Tax=Caldivirga sp. UBA161 TaxID=1915569 RepID=UPI0025C3E22A|nr:ABC transporter permease [Caldivirga sp. UBA161]